MTTDNRPLLLKFDHGLGDLVQLTIVIRHLWKKWPEKPIHVSSRAAWAGLLEGIAHEQFVLGHEPAPHNYSDIIRMEWPECIRSYAEHPSTKAEFCLREEFQIHPQLELCRYLLAPSPAARAEAERIANRYGSPYAMIHYQGHTSRHRKDIPEDIVRETCRVMHECGVQPIVLDFDHQSGLDLCDLLHDRVSSQVVTALAARSRINIGIDSGPGHIFQAVDTPAIISWGEHHPLHYAPLAPNVLHHLPKNHPSFIRRGVGGQEFFESHYRFEIAPRADLPWLVERQLQGADLRATNYSRAYYEEHRAAGLDYAVHGQWQRDYGNWFIESLDLIGKRVMDAGCACGSIALGMQRAGASVTGVDISRYMIQRGRQQWPELELLHRDLADVVDIGCNSYDFVHSAHSAEHWWPGQVPKILSEVQRILKPGGIFWCSLDTEELFARQHRNTHEARMKEDPTHICVKSLAWWDELRRQQGWIDAADDVRPKLMAHSGSFLRATNNREAYDWDWFAWRKAA